MMLAELLTLRRSPRVDAVLRGPRAAGRPGALYRSRHPGAGPGGWRSGPGPFRRRPPRRRRAGRDAAGRFGPTRSADPAGPRRRHAGLAASGAGPGDPAAGLLFLVAALALLALLERDRLSAAVAGTRRTHAAGRSRRPSASAAVAASRSRRSSWCRWRGPSACRPHRTGPWRPGAPRESSGATGGAPAGQRCRRHRPAATREPVGHSRGPGRDARALLWRSMVPDRLRRSELAGDESDPERPSSSTRLRRHRRRHPAVRYARAPP